MVRIFVRTQPICNKRFNGNGPKSIESKQNFYCSEFNSICFCFSYPIFRIMKICVRFNIIEINWIRCLTPTNDDHSGLNFHNENVQKQRQFHALQTSKVIQRSQWASLALSLSLSSSLARACVAYYEFVNKRIHVSAIVISPQILICQGQNHTTTYQ